MGDAAADGGLDARLATELERAGMRLEELAATLCLDPDVARRHMGPLQRFDQVTQILGEIATILRRRTTQEETIAAIRLDALKERMTTHHD